MGFRPAAIVRRLEWPEDDPLHGLTVKVRSVSVDKYNEIMRLMYGDAGRPPAAENVCTADKKPCGVCVACTDNARQWADLQTKGLDSSEKILNEFAASLKEWDYEHPETGEELPPTREGVGRADASHMTGILAAWASQLASVPLPLRNGSKNGRSQSDSEEEILALATVSQSQPN